MTIENTGSMLKKKKKPSAQSAHVIEKSAKKPKLGHLKVALPSSSPLPPTQSI